MNPTIKRLISNLVKAEFAIVLGLLVYAQRSLAQEPKAPLTALEVIHRVVAMSERRNEALRSFSSTRAYTIEFNGIKHLQADMVVSMTYEWPNKKELIVVSEKGSGTLRNRVLHPLLAAELEAMKPENQQLSVISPDNYSFELVDYIKNDSGECYILEVHPRHKNKFLFKGRIWVEGKGFAITRIMGEPAVNPSFWTKKTDFERAYKEVNGFWLPACNQSVTQVRLFGHAQLTIEYKDYRLKETRQFDPAPPADFSATFMTGRESGSDNRRDICVTGCNLLR